MSFEKFKLGIKHFFYKTRAKIIQTCIDTFCQKIRNLFKENPPGKYRSWPEQARRANTSE